MSEAQPSCLSEIIHQLPIYEAIVIGGLCAFAPTNEVAIYGSLAAGAVYGLRQIFRKKNPRAEQEFSPDPMTRRQKGRPIKYLDPNATINDLIKVTSQLPSGTYPQVMKDGGTLLRRRNYK